MKLNELLDEMNYQFIQGHLDEEVSQIDYDSRTVQSGSLFVCIPGARLMDTLLLIRLFKKVQRLL